jgi:hypothetical protein
VILTLSHFPLLYSPQYSIDQPPDFISSPDLSTIPQPVPYLTKAQHFSTVPLTLVAITMTLDFQICMNSALSFTQAVCFFAQKGGVSDSQSLIGCHRAHSVRGSSFIPSSHIGASLGTLYALPSYVTVRAL